MARSTTSRTAPPRGSDQPGARDALTSAAPRPDRAAAERPASRAPYALPSFERLGSWSALTLQQSVQIYP